MVNFQALIQSNNEQPQSSSHEANLFAQMWQKIEKAEKSLQSAQRKRSKIVSLFNKELLPLEQKNIELRYEFIQHLLGFLEKKSFSRREKTELACWIQEEIRKLTCSPFHYHLDVRSLLEQLEEQQLSLRDKPTSHELDELKDMLIALSIKEEFELTPTDLENLLQSFERSEEEFFELLTKLRDEHRRSSHDDEAWHQQSEFDTNPHTGEANDEEDNFTFERESSQSAAKNLTDKAVTQLFKRLVQKLHPDKAKNDADRQYKHDLMLKLTKARRNNDIYTVLQMVREHGDSADAQFSDQQLDHMVFYLEQKLSELKAKKRALKSDSSVDALIYSIFHAQSNQKQLQKFNEYSKALIHEQSHHRGKKAYLKNVKAVKRAIAERQRVQYFHHDIENVR